LEQRVLCCDDHEDAEEFDKAFDADWQRRRLALERDVPRLVRLYEPRRTAHSALAHLSLAEREQRPADVVLIDDHLDSGIPRAPEPKALELMKAIFDRYGDERPVCVLLTAEKPPEFIHTFRELGGHQYADKRWGWEECTKVIWEALRGELWRPKPVRGWQGELDISPRERLLLPYLAADIPTSAIVVDLNESGRLRRSVVPDRVNEWRSGLAGKLGVNLDGQSVALANAVRDAGHVWVPLSYRHLLPAQHPDHGAPFRLGAPG
jgi:DNA-binding NarL/FixJ family response regulator